MGKYLLNGFLLIIPVLIWNIIFYKLLPQKYSIDTKSSFETAENIFRIIVFALPLLMKISLETKLQKFGMGLYLLGLAIYFASWIVQIYFPDSLCGKSNFGLLAPAYTSIIWLLGIGMVGQFFFLANQYSWFYITMAAAFVVSHTMHMYYVLRLN